MGMFPSDVRREPTVPSSTAPVSAAAITRENDGEISHMVSPGRRRIRGGSAAAAAAAAATPAAAVAAPAVSASAPPLSPLEAESEVEVVAPAAAPPAVMPGHKTVRVRARVYEVPTLGYLCVQMLAENADSIVDLRGVGEDAARQLLREIMGRQKLTYPLAKVFMECGDEELSSALAKLNLWDAIPAGRQGRHNRHL